MTARAGTTVAYQDGAGGLDRDASGLPSEGALGRLAKVTEDRAGAGGRIHGEEGAIGARAGIGVAHQDGAGALDRDASGVHSEWAKDHNAKVTEDRAGAGGRIHGEEGAMTA